MVQTSRRTSRRFIMPENNCETTFFHDVFLYCTGKPSIGPGHQIDRAPTVLHASRYHIYGVAVNPITKMISLHTTAVDSSSQQQGARQHNNMPAVPVLVFIPLRGSRAAQCCTFQSVANETQVVKRRERKPTTDWKLTSFPPKAAKWLSQASCTFVGA